MFYDADGRLRSLLASWTDVAAPDVFIQVAAGRSFVRPDDLATLAALIEQIERGHGG
ncbi:elements of external origin (plasmid) [Sinorhizobium fredii CCBAU 83666]|nr:elements of external origin [Sinorhizobium fredii CCBAU 83666]